MNITKYEQVYSAKINQLCATLGEAIQILIKQSMKSYKFDETYKAVVTADLGNNMYKVNINDTEYTVKCKTRKLNKGEPEWVTVPRGNWNELIIR